MYKVYLNDNWMLNEYGKEESLPVAVPGDINDTLRKAGVIPDPHFDANVRDCLWVTSKVWDYTLTFICEKKDDVPVRLVCKGIDGTAEAFLNGVSLGTVQNAFRAHTFEVSDLLVPGENTLLVRFAAIDQLIGERDVRVENVKEEWARKGPSRMLRKPGYNFGWDWALSLPSLGLCADVYLEYDYVCEIVDHSIRTYTNGRVDFDFEVSEKAFTSGYALRLTVSGHGVDITQTISKSSHRTYTSVTIPEPKLWYPAGYGEQPLYTYTLELIIDGACVQTITGRFGIREISILEEPFTPDAGHGRSFWFLVNGKRVFIKGGNYIPMELWPGITNQADYDYYLPMAVEANFNMLRVWGGGFYENDRFYDLCDELGILIWQDFMFASSGYPVDALRDEIVLEATYQLRRLRNHTSIAIWCGCNEDVYSWSYGPQIGMDAKITESAGNTQNDTDEEAGNAQERRHRLKYDPLLYTAILRGLVGKLCPNTPYVESSPQSYDDAGNLPNSGNCHISCWKTALFDENNEHGAWRKHFDEVCSFDSEFCIQGPCREALIRSFFKQENHWPPNDVWDIHIQRGHADLPHFKQTLLIAGATIGEITDLSTYVRHGQATHVEMMRSEFDSARSDYPNNGGTMMWMFNDCWPTSNWSIIDYEKVPKPSYYAAKRACAPISPIIFERKGTVKFSVSNHSLSDISVKAVWGCEQFDGTVIQSTAGECRIPSGETGVLCTLPKAELPGCDYYFLDVTADGKPLDRVIYYPNGFKELPYPEPAYRIEAYSETETECGYVCEFTVAADSFLRLFHVISEDKNARPIVSDNFFDLTKGQKKKVCVTFREKPSSTALRFGEWYHNWE